MKFLYQKLSHQTRVHWRLLASIFVSSTVIVSVVSCHHHLQIIYVFAIIHCSFEFLLIKSSDELMTVWCNYLQALLQLFKTCGTVETLRMRSVVSNMFHIFTSLILPLELHLTTSELWFGQEQEGILP